MLYDQTLDAFNHSKAPGTMKNKLVQAQLYLKFCISYRVNYLKPSVLSVAMYTRFLGNSFASPSTIKNYLSGAKTWVEHHLGDVSAFTASQPADVLKWVGTSLNHVTARAYALSSSDIQVICSFLDSRPSVPPAIKSCILIAYASFLRASNLTSPTMSVWGGPHTLRACDVLDTQDGLCLLIRSTKTLSKAKPTFLHICEGGISSLCPVRAWRQYKNLVNPILSGPAFVYGGSVPLTPRPIVAIMRLALTSAGHPNADRVTMHSLRRGGVQCAAAEGATREQLMAQGTWRSQSGIQPYINQEQRIIPRLIAKSLAG